MADDLRINVDEIRRRMDSGEDVLFIDTRNPQAWESSSQKLPEAVRIPNDALEQHLSDLPRNKPIVTYCT
jgi:rhodanese-related sulfurtransferase